MRLVWVAEVRCGCGEKNIFISEAQNSRTFRCSRCGKEVVVDGTNFVPEVRLLDCEVRDWERLGALSSTAQQKVLQALESGRAQLDLYPLLLKLKEYGVLICT